MIIHSLSEYMKAVREVVTEWTPSDAGWYLHPWFRGQRQESWPLQPSWNRRPRLGGPGADFYNEGNLLEQFKLRAPTYLDAVPRSDWEWLFLMQHYGLPTRLLDWTEGSLIALYFAVREDADDDGSAAVWVLNPWWLNKQTFEDYELFPADDERADGHAPVPPGGKLVGRKPLALTPHRASRRIAAQQGFFTVHGTEAHALDDLSSAPTAQLRKWVVDAASIPLIREGLSLAGITETLVFPELTGLCGELRRRFLGMC